MKFIFVAMVLALFSGQAFADSVEVDVNGASCAAVTSDDGDSARTTSSCATGAQLPSVRYNLDGYSLLADLASGDVGAELAVCPGLSLGLTGGASTSKAGGDESHDSHGTLYARTSSSVWGGSLELKLAASRRQAVGSMDSNGAAASAKYLFARKAVSPYAEAGVGYSQSTLSDDSSVTSSLALGVRVTLVD